MDRIERLEKAVLSQHATIKKLVSETLSLRIFALAVIEQPGIDLRLLRDEYVDRWEETVQQVPPEMQDKEFLQKLLIEIQLVLSRPGRGGA